MNRQVRPFGHQSKRVADYFVVVGWTIPDSCSKADNYPPQSDSAENIDVVNHLNGTSDGGVSTATTDSSDDYIHIDNTNYDVAQLSSVENALDKVIDSHSSSKSSLTGDKVTEFFTAGVIDRYPLTDYDDFPFPQVRVSDLALCTHAMNILCEAIKL